MDKILYYGNLDECGTKLCNYLAEKYDVTAIYGKALEYEVDAVCKARHDVDIDSLCDENGFIAVIAVGADCGELNELMYASCRGGIARFICIKENETFSKRPQAKKIEELMAGSYAKEYGINATVLNVPQLYGEITAPEYIRKVSDEIIRHNRVVPGGARHEYCDFLHIEDLCCLVRGMLEHDGSERNISVEVRSGYPINTEIVINAVKARYPEVISEKYEDQPEDEREINAVHPEYWTPHHNFASELPALFEHCEKSYTSCKKRKRKKIFSIAKRIALMFIIFLGIELYTNFMYVASELQFVDMRILFIIGTYLGLGKRYGYAAAALCCIASIAQAVWHGIYLRVIFYHVNNWIPMAVYIITAMVTGVAAERYRRVKE